VDKKMITPCYGEPFEVDISDKVCKKYGFTHGQRIKNYYGDKGVVEGVAPATEGMTPEPEVLWFTLDMYHGKSCYTLPIDIESIH
jgi:hypothetical protein